MDESGWCLTESDPQVFSELLRNLGVKGLQVDDLYSLDESELASLRPIHALIFLFKYVGRDVGSAGVEVDPLDCGVWFANQVINNSCGTIAALNAVMNIPPVESEHAGESISVGPELQNLRDFGAGMSSLDLGHVVASSDNIREVHNSFSKTSPFSMDPSMYQDREKEDAYHFVTYLPVNGVLYELDGLRGTPVMHAAVDDDWLEQARETIQARIETYPPGSLMFNLLAVRSAAIPRLERQLADESLPMAERMAAQDQLDAEKAKAAQGKFDNSLRRHNMLPLVLGLLEALNGSKAKVDVIDAARTKSKERREKEREREKAKKACK